MSVPTLEQWRMNRRISHWKSLVLNLTISTSLYITSPSYTHIRLFASLSSIQIQIRQCSSPLLPKRSRELILSMTFLANPLSPSSFYAQLLKRSFTTALLNPPKKHPSLSSCRLCADSLFQIWQPLGFPRSSGWSKPFSSDGSSSLERFLHSVDLWGCLLPLQDF
jgi:hypothetical protein